MIIKTKINNESKENIYNSSNIIKTIYFEEQKYLILKFVKVRVDKSTKLKIYKGTTYHLKNLPKRLYEEFERADSQGKFFNKNIASDNTIIVHGKYDLYPSEIEDLLKEQNDILEKIKEESDENNKTEK